MADDPGAKIVRIIMNGKVDGSLQAILDAAVNRKKYCRDRKALELLASLEPGDQVAVNDGIKPRYLINRVGVVQSVYHHGGAPFAQIDFGRPISQRYGRVLGIPMSCLRVVRKAKKEEVTDGDIS